jgi:osmotically-inducible protein OsmY
MTRRIITFSCLLGLALLLAWPLSGRAQQGPWQDRIASMVLSEIQRDSALAASSITVDCYNGTVMLTGFVSSFELRNNAEAAAMRVPGIIRIIDELNQNQDRSAADAARDGVIQTALQSTLSQYSSGDPPIVMARGRVYDSIVYLLGSVSDPTMNDILQSSITALPGVHAVVAHLVIQKGSVPSPPADQSALATGPSSPPLAPVPLATENLRLPPSTAPRHRKGQIRNDLVASRSVAYAVQLGSEPSQALAFAAWRRRKAANVDLLGRLEPTVTQADLGTLGIHYRLRAGPLPDQEAAAALCAALAARHTPCLVVRDTGQDALSASPAPEPLPPAEIAATSVPNNAAKAVRPKRKTVVAPTIPRVPLKTPGGSYFVQLASRSSDADARAYWRDLLAKDGSLLSDLKPTVTAADLGTRGIHYRLKAGPLAGRGAAVALCTKLKSRGADCLPVFDAGSSSAP